MSYDGRRTELLAALGVLMVVAPQPRRDQSRRAVADRPAVDAHHGQYGLAGGRDEGLARGVGLLNRERAFFERKPLRFDRIDHNRPCDPGQNIATKRMRDQYAVAADDPRVRRSAFGDTPLAVDQPRLACP